MNSAYHLPDSDNEHHHSERRPEMVRESLSLLAFLSLYPASTTTMSNLLQKPRQCRGADANQSPMA
jgi:hypothetical protein